MMKKLLMVVVFALCAGGSFTSSAEVITWTGAAGNHKWETGRNWDLNRVPNVATDDIVVGPFDELTVISNFNRAAYTIDKSLTVKRNARMRWTTTYGSQQRIGDHGRLIVEDGGQYVFDPTEGLGVLNAGFSVRGSVWMYPGSLIENINHAYSPHGGFGPSWRLMGGTLDLASSGSWTFLHRAAVCGTEIWSPYLQPYDDVSVHVLDLVSGTLKVEGHHWEGSGLWNTGHFPAGRSYVNFTEYSDAALVVKVDYTAANVYTTYFNGDKARVRYDDRCITQNEFNDLFMVSSDGAYTTIRLKETADPWPRSIVAQTQHVLDCVYDGDTHEAGFVAALYPRTGCVIEYSWNGGATWSDVPDRRIAAQEWQFLARVRDPSGTLPTWTSEPFTARISPKSLTVTATIADIPDFVWTGSEIRPEPVIGDTILSQKVTLTKSVDFEYSYENNVEVGEATVVVTGIGNYTGEIRKTFRITPKMLDGDVYVDAAAQEGGDGASWATAVRDVDMAANLVKAGNTIHVRAGTYRIIQPITLSEKPGVKLLGDGADTTVIAPAAGCERRLLDLTACDGAEIRNLTFRDAALTVVDGDANGGAISIVDSANVVIDACRIEGNGCKTTGSSAVGHARGGGVYVSDGSLTITGSLIRRNWLSAGAKSESLCYGAGICSLRSDVTVLDSEIEQNYVKQSVGSSARGGGIYAIGTDASNYNTLLMKGCLVADNSIQASGPMLHDRLHGDGITCSSYMNLLMEEVTVANNGRNYPQNYSGKFCSSGILTEDKNNYRGLTNVVVCGHAYNQRNVYGSTEKSSNVVNTATFTGHYAVEGDAGYKSTCALAANAVRTVWVDPSAGDDAAAGGEVAPLKTVSEAFRRFNASGEIETIRLAVGTYSATSGESFPCECDYGFNLRIVGAGKDATVFDGEGVTTANRFLRFGNCGGIVLSGIGFRNLKLETADQTLGKEQGGAVMFSASADVTVTDCAFTGIDFAFKCALAWPIAYGGALGTVMTRIAVSDCEFTSNTCLCAVGGYARALGGAAGFSPNSYGTISGCTFTGNRILSHGYDGWGGALYGGSLSGSDLVFRENGLDCSGFGGAAYLGGGTWTWLDVRDNRGSGIVGAGTVMDSTVVGNTIDISQKGTLNLSNTVYGVATRFTDKGGNSLAAAAGEQALAHLYVDPTAAEGGNGTAGSPFRTLGAAVAVCADATVIHLAEGTYAEEACPIDFTGLRHVKVVGAGRDKTVFDLAGRIVTRFANVADSFDVTFSDLTVRNVASKEAECTSIGAAFSITKSGPVVFRSVDFRDCVQTNTNAGSQKWYYGGIVCIGVGSGASFVDCAFDNCRWHTTNAADTYLYGGAIGGSGVGLLVDRTTFNGCSVYNPKAVNTSNGYYKRYGGAIGLDAGLAAIRSSVFTSNTTYFTETVYGLGNAFYVGCRVGGNYAGATWIENSLFKDNENAHGAAIYHGAENLALALVNNIFYGQLAHVRASSCTASHNAATPEEGAPAWRAQDAALVPLAADAPIFDANPKGRRRWALAEDSELIDAGENVVWQEGSLDLNGDSRRAAFFNRRVSIADIGPSEHPRIIPGLMLMVW